MYHREFNVELSYYQMPISTLKGTKLIIYSLLGGDCECAYLPLFTMELRLQLVSEEDKLTFLEKNEGNCHVKKGTSSVTTLLIPREDVRSLENRRAGIYSCDV